MPSLFERGYRAAAKTELERAVRKIEEKDKNAQELKEPNPATLALESNIKFAQQLHLISAEQAAAYRERIKKATREREQKAESEQNQIENAANSAGGKKQYASVEEALTDINRERAVAEQQAQKQREQTQNASAKATEDPEHTHT